MGNQSNSGSVARCARSLSATVPINLKINGETYNLQLEPRVSLLDAVSVRFWLMESVSFSTSNWQKELLLLC